MALSRGQTRVKSVVEWFEKTPSNDPPKKNRHRNSSGDDPFIRAVITSAKREVDGINRYSWHEIKWDDAKKRFAEDPEGASGDSEAETGWASEAKWNSPYCLQGHEVELYARDDNYVFWYRPEDVTGYLLSADSITASEVTDATVTGKKYGKGDVTLFIHNPDRGTSPVPPLTEDKFSGSSQRMDVFNQYPTSIPGDDETAGRRLMLTCTWVAGRWVVAGVECKE